MYFYTHGKYFKDYHVIFSLIPSNSKKVIELCFGDVYLANICKQNNIDWTGYDISDYFVEHAKMKNFNAIKANLHEYKISGDCDVVIISRSLYQFNDILDEFFKDILKCSKNIIICESLKSFGNSKNKFFRRIAKYLTHSGDSKHVFRYNEDSILNDIDYLCNKFSLIVKRKIMMSDSRQNVFLLLQKT
tara:strand:- start:419 stop:985 length:567 start_codon:yes stop_codon:yes gene_type:complete